MKLKLLNEWNQVYLLWFLTFVCIVYIVNKINPIPLISKDTYYPTNYYIQNPDSLFQKEWLIFKMLMETIKNSIWYFIYYPRKILSPYINEHVFL